MKAKHFVLCLLGAVALYVLSIGPATRLLMRPNGNTPLLFGKFYAPVFYGMEQSPTFHDAIFDYTALWRRHE